ncbi:MAG: hypothetical protein AB3N21_06195 [Ruegeria sp.]|uniref:hypothetical protein n=1 Tax=Ruegeria sp. TaxID=1879320 RepID=UPI00349EBC80
MTGALIVFAVVVCGHRFRLAWKEQSHGWQRRAWVYGVPAALGLMVLAFLPLKY